MGDLEVATERMLGRQDDPLVEATGDILMRGRKQQSLTRSVARLGRVEREKVVLWARTSRNISKNCWICLWRGG